MFFASVGLNIRIFHFGLYRHHEVNHCVLGHDMGISTDNVAQKKLYHILPICPSHNLEPRLARTHTLSPIHTLIVYQCLYNPQESRVFISYIQQVR